MDEHQFPKPVDEVVATLTEIFRHQGDREIVEVLETAQASIEQTGYDNWNGGTYSWALNLEVPIVIFARLGDRIEEAEKRISAKLQYLSRLYTHDTLDSVAIVPLAAGTDAIGQRRSPPDHEVERIWPADRFRLFLSHVSKHKIAVAKLKDELALRGVAGFVAHEDIEPSLEWCKEIELALRSMHALAALIMPEFHGSNWTDQEIGWAFGRGVQVLPVRLGVDPYGFAGKFQGIPGSLEHPAVLAIAIVKALLANPQTRSEMRRCLIAAFVGAASVEMADALCSLIVDVADFTAEEKTTIRGACTTNRRISATPLVVDRIFEAIGQPRNLEVVPYGDEEIPF